MSYRLSATLLAHSSDVRAVASPSSDLVLSASRDTTAIVWNREPSGSQFRSTVFPAGSRYVNSVAYLPSNPAGTGYLVAGGQDSTITVFSLVNPKREPDHTLLGHTSNVCSLDTCEDGTIISGSWDMTARVWKDFQCIYSLEGHTQSVWAVLILEPAKFLTASADKTIKLWHEHKQMHTYNGHTDAVRGLALMPGIGFASCSNDSEIRVWTLDGNALYTLSGHTSFIYSLAVLPNGALVSSGEDRTVRLWQGGQCVQTIVHPAISVWSVSTMPNGDIVTGTSDGVVRIFSCSGDRWAPEADLREYDEKISNQALNKEQLGGLKQSDIKGKEALDQPGAKDGQVLVIRDGSSIDAYQWDGSVRQWVKVGQVVEGDSSGKKQQYQGKKYDYVFDVDVQEGAPPLKLPYNASENPYVAAQRFLDANDLPHSYLDEVVKFIEKNITPISLTGPEEFVDPFTGASRYRGSGAGDSTPAPGPSSFVDPFTGSSRYSGVAAQAPPPPPPPPSATTLPIVNPITFKQANVPAMRNKTYQINDALKMEISTSALAMSLQETQIIDQAFDCLIFSLGPSTYQQPDSSVTNVTIETLTQILERWPVSQRFPVLDLARLISAFYPNSYNEPGQGLAFFNAFLAAAEWSEPWPSSLPKSRETNVTLALRSIANGLQPLDAEKSTLTEWVPAVFEKLLSVPYDSYGKQHRVLLATIAFNLSCNLLRNMDSQHRDPVLQLIIQILSEETKDSETVYRTLAALGNLLYSSQKSGLSIADSQSQVLDIFVNSAAQNIPEDRVRNITQEILRLL